MYFAVCVGVRCLNPTSDSRFSFHNKRIVHLSPSRTQAGQYRASQVCIKQETGANKISYATSEKENNSKRCPSEVIISQPRVNHASVPRVGQQYAWTTQPK